MILAHLRRLQPTQRHSADNTSGNAMIYVLLAIALFGILTATLSSQNNQSDGQDIDDEMVELYANELIEYAAAAKNVVDQMIMTGSTIDDLDFINPTSAGFDTPPHIHKVFHPQGGGLNYTTPSSPPFVDDTNEGWYIIKNTHIEWTPTTADDVVITAFKVEKSICSLINEKISGDPTIPVHTQAGYGMYSHFVDGSNDFTTLECPQCEGYPSFCVESTDGTQWAFYSILAGR